MLTPLRNQCDGNWPKCSTCTTKNRACGYVGREGQSRATAVKSRLESLEELLAALKTSSPEQLSTILNSIRDDDDAVGAIESLASQTVALNRQDGQYGLLLLANKLTCDLRLLLPEAPVMMRAVNSFFSCSGKLFHVFSETYILQCYRAIFDESQAPSELLKAKVCCLAAVAAVGAQYSPDTVSKEVEVGLYNLARHFLEVTIEHEPLHAIKACALFAQYNIMNKEMVSLTYVGK